MILKLTHHKLNVFCVRACVQVRMCVGGVGIEFRASLSWARLCHWATSLPNMAYFCSWATEPRLSLTWHTFAPEPAFLSVLFLVRGCLFFHFISSKFWNFLLFSPYNFLYKLFSIKYLIIILFCPSPLKHKQASIVLDMAGLSVSRLFPLISLYTTVNFL